MMQVWRVWLMLCALPVAALGAGPEVFLFLSPDCPVSNGLIPEMNRIARDYESRSVRLYVVYSDPDVREEDARRHASEFHLHIPFRLDPRQELARQWEVTATPEAVLVLDGQVFYRGRIEDRYADLGTSRTQPGRADLRAALDEVLAGKPVSQPRTPVIGCAISFHKTDVSQEVTFARDVAPILYRNCASCHRPGESAPFPLLTYQDARRHADQVGVVTRRRLMPPWKPEPVPGVHFRHERRLSSGEIQILTRWADGGAPAGDLSQAPKPPADSAEWQLGPPDLVLAMPAYEIPAEGSDVYRCFVLPSGLTSNRYIRAAQFRPGNRAVHHALMLIDHSGAARSRDAEEAGPGYTCFGTPGFLPGGGIGGWTPGSGAIEMPEGTATRIPAKADVVLQVHYHPTGKPETDDSRLGLYFAAAPPTRRLMAIGLGSRDIDISAGQAAYHVSDHFTLPVDVELVGIIPHAHYICREMKGTARFPDGKELVLLWIRDWDFNQQAHYTYTKPIHLPEGTEVRMDFVYDNSDANARNPNHPPKRVVWGPGITDEMAGLHLQVIPGNDDDASELSSYMWGKFMRSVGGGFVRNPE